MSTSHSSEDPLAGASRDDMMAALFASLVMQQSNMALMFLGKVPHPESGATVKDMEGARYFIDQLEMLEVKTKGNLSKDEQQLLKQSLMSVRLAFVEAVESPDAEKASPSPAPSSETPPAPAPEVPAEPASPVDPAKEEPHKKFTKKY